MRGWEVVTSEHAAPNAYLVVKVGSPASVTTEVGEDTGGAAPNLMVLDFAMDRPGGPDDVSEQMLFYLLWVAARAISADRVLPAPDTAVVPAVLLTEKKQHSLGTREPKSSWMYRDIAGLPPDAEPLLGKSPVEALRQSKAHLVMCIDDY